MDDKKSWLSAHHLMEYVLDIRRALLRFIRIGVSKVSYIGCFIIWLQLQVDNGLNQNLNSKVLSAPNLTALDFPALSPTDSQNNVAPFSVHDQQQSYRSLEKELLMFKSSSIAPSLGATDFASAVKKMAAHDSSIWKYDKNHSPTSTIGSSRSSHNLSSSYGRSSYGDRLANRSSSRSAPVWLETGEAVGNVFDETYMQLNNIFDYMACVYAL